MIKSAQNVIGSVMCCPGCFSLYRASAIRQVMDKYATPTRTPFTVYVKDTGRPRGCDHHKVSLIPAESQVQHVRQNDVHRICQWHRQTVWLWQEAYDRLLAHLEVPRPRLSGQSLSTRVKDVDEARYLTGYNVTGRRFVHVFTFLIY